MDMEFQQWASADAWTEGASVDRKINLQVGDVHKALLSLSRCADMVRKPIREASRHAHR